MTNYFFNFLLFNMLLVFTHCEDSDQKIEQTYRFQSSIMIDGLTRTYLVNLPSTYYDNAQELPLVIGLHGTGGIEEHLDRNYGVTQRAGEL